LHQRKLRSDKYKPSAGLLLEFYESGSSVEADEDTDAEAGGDVGTDPGAGVATNSQHRTRSAVGKQSASTAADVVCAVKATKKKKKRKATSPLVVITPSIPMPCSREVKLEDEEEYEAIEELPVTEDRPVRRLESPAAKRQWELVEKTSEDALRRGIEAQRTAAAAQAKTPMAIRPPLFRPKLRIPVLRSQSFHLLLLYYTCLTLQGVCCVGRWRSHRAT
jgi:hypothetical protein